MAAANDILEAKPRESSGKNVARRLRKSGQVPGVLYGASGAAAYAAMAGLAGSGALFALMAARLGSNTAGRSRDVAIAQTMRNKGQNLSLTKGERLEHVRSRDASRHLEVHRPS